MREGRLGYNSYNKRYGLLSSDLWIDTGLHCGESDDGQISGADERKARRDGRIEDAGSDGMGWENE